MAVLKMNAQAYDLHTKGDAPVLVEFSAPWCVYCRRLEPAFAQAAEEWSGTLAFGQVDIDEEPALAQRENIELAPTLRIIRGGKVLGEVVAPESKAQLDAFIRDALKSGAADAAEEKPVHDMIIVGGGPGGYTAALYAVRAGLDAVVLEKLSAGGQMALTDQIDNYPGFEDGIDGFALGEKMRKGAERFGAKSRMTEVTALRLDGPVKTVQTSEGELRGRTVVIATGASPRHLGLAREEELTGRGVHYCASCDGMFYRDRTVVVVGGGNSAAEDALILSRICRRVILVHRRDTLRAEKVYHDPLMEAENVTFVWDSVTQELLGGERVTGVRVKNVKTGEESELACDAVFVSVGRQPASALVQGQLETNPAGYIAADESTRTSLPGVFAVGDVRTKAVRQVVTAVADGAAAVHCAQAYLAGEA